MFSADNNFSSFYPLFYDEESPSFTNVISENNNNGSNILYQHYDAGKFYPPISNTTTSIQNPTSSQQQPSIINPQNTTLVKKSMGKKDRHTKISTAQGVRDRRVRLSMNIARDFFNLQDMLGFDKASKTLGWLLAKSKASIDELNDQHTNDEKHQQDDNDNENNNDESSSKKKNKKRKNKYLKNSVPIEVLKRREEARERARVRTRNKKIIGHYVCNNQQQQRVQQDLVICQQSNNNTFSNELINKEGITTVRDSFVVKGNDKSIDLFHNYNNYEMISSSKDDQDTCCDYCYNKSASESCNYPSPTSGFPAFNIINLSTEIHINARPWDTYHNQILHYC